MVGGTYWIQLTIPVSPESADAISNYLFELGSIGSYESNDNLIAYNGIGIQFLSDWQGNHIEGNRLKGNLTPVAVSGGKTAARNLWRGNYWDVYEGFDRDGDGVGDTPFEYYGYADRIWMDVPPARFFKSSPMLEVLDFLERLAPFSEPNMILRDERPLMYVETGDFEAVENR